MSNLNLSSYLRFSNQKSLASRILKSLSIVVLALNLNFSAAGQDNSLDFTVAALPYDYVTLPNLIPSGNYTKEAWINIRSFPGGGYHIVMAGAFSAFYINGTTQFLEGFHNGNLGAVAEAGPTPTLATATWYHVAVTYNATTNTMRIYRNGVQTAVGTPDAGAYAESENYIGTYNNGGGPGTGVGFDGQIDEVSMWGVERSAAQILASYNAGAGCVRTGEEPGLQGYYRFNQGTAGGANPTETTLNDQSERCVPNNGTLVNFTLSGATSNWVAADPGVTVSCGGTFANALLVGNSICINDEDMTPAAADHTDFGQGSVIVRTFTIQNTGTATLNIGTIDINGPDAARFVVTTPPAATVAAGGSTTFDITFTAIANGARNATVTVNNTDGDLPYDFAITAAIFNLPVELKSFTARKMGSQSQLNWVTVTETFNRGFEIQRSSDGVNWTAIGFVPGAGNSTSEQSYSFVDPSPLKGRNAYRLRQVDLDNRSKFSEARSVTFASESTIVYPVPTSDKVTIELKDSKLIGSIATISDQQGKIVQRITISNMQQQVSLAAVPDGVYFLKLEDGTSHKLVKQ